MEVEPEVRLLAVMLELRRKALVVCPELRTIFEHLFEAALDRLQLFGKRGEVVWLILGRYLALLETLDLLQ